MLHSRAHGGNSGTELVPVVDFLQGVPGDAAGRASVVLFTNMCDPTVAFVKMQRSTDARGNLTVDYGARGPAFMIQYYMLPEPHRHKYRAKQNRWTHKNNLGRSSMQEPILMPCEIFVRIPPAWRDQYGSALQGRINVPGKIRATCRIHVVDSETGFIMTADAVNHIRVFERRHFERDVDVGYFPITMLEFVAVAQIVARTTDVSSPLLASVILDLIDFNIKLFEGQDVKANFDFAYNPAAPSWSLPRALVCLARAQTLESLFILRHATCRRYNLRSYAFLQPLDGSEKSATIRNRPVWLQPPSSTAPKHGGACCICGRTFGIFVKPCDKCGGLAYCSEQCSTAHLHSTFCQSVSDYECDDMWDTSSEGSWDSEDDSGCTSGSW